MALEQYTRWLFEPYSSKRIAQTAFYHRRLLVISGSNTFCDNTIKTVTDCVPSGVCLKLFSYDELSGKKRQRALGSENDIAIIDCREKFSPSIITAVAGTIRAEGCLIIVCPDFSKWPFHFTPLSTSHGFSQQKSRYILRLIELIKQNKWIAMYENGAFTRPKTKTYHRDDVTKFCSTMFKSAEQKHVFEQLVKEEHANTLQATLTAPRGRGKSTLLALFTQHLLQQGKHVLITSSLRENVSKVFEHLYPVNQTQASDAISAPTKGDHLDNFGAVKWVAPDNPILLKTNKEFDIVIVDEAASLPINVVNNIVQANKQWLLSTTVQGYEGSGKGFVQKLLPRLLEQTDCQSAGNTVKQYSLLTPIRWFPDDVLEHFINSVFLMEKALPTSATTINNNAPALRQTGFEELENNAIEQVMSILSLAHYQTTPDDLMRIIDSPDVILQIVEHNNMILGAAVINIEGTERLQNLAEKIASGERRPKGHLSAQRIALLTANARHASYRYWRINRIAVSPDFQGVGIGCRIVDEIKKCASEQGIDAVTTSYGKTKSLNSFWSKNDFSIVDNGRKPNKASGETSALAIYPISQRAVDVTQQLASLLSSNLTHVRFGELCRDVAYIHTQKLSQFLRGTRTIDDVWPTLKAISIEALASKNSRLTLYTDEIEKIISVFKSHPEIAALFTQQEPDMQVLAKLLDVQGYKQTVTKFRDLIT
ncbi:hypothetical protein BK026_00680 [Alteromonas sp. V450]|uniref:GNAT family N-acetyltransferase n=1 Tax=Alteromonas sp. V450 TaxID=1912139 RepID=UPI0008FF1416|nr:GNAT family N-acetyltransferase [Alteromonas sp. V450]OJF67434.1 hypothetical protein BK026_00680 [Alteromonas sp. V450]